MRVGPAEECCVEAAWQGLKGRNAEEELRRFGVCQRPAWPWKTQRFIIESSRGMSADAEPEGLGMLRWGLTASAGRVWKVLPRRALGCPDDN